MNNLMYKKHYKIFNCNQLFCMNSLIKLEDNQCYSSDDICIQSLFLKVRT